MKLHLESDLFSELIEVTAEHLHISSRFIEKNKRKTCCTKLAYFPLYCIINSILNSDLCF